MKGRVAEVHRIGSETPLGLTDLLQSITSLSPTNSSTGEVTVVNVDGHESFVSTIDEYRQFLVRLNNVLRNRADLLILWPVNDKPFAEKVVGILKQVGGKSPFGTDPIYELEGMPRDKWPSVLEGILQVANWTLEDAALDWQIVEDVTKNATNIGSYLDEVQSAIITNFEFETVGFVPPQLLIVLSSGKAEVREICRNLRRADSYYAEPNRLTMYTKRSNVAEWWGERNKNLKTCLAHVVALFNVHIVSISGSSVVHAVLNFGDDELKQIPESIQRNIGNAKVVIKSTELYKYSTGDEIDNREYGIGVKPATLAAYEAIQKKSKEQHKSINTAIMELVCAADGGFVSYDTEVGPEDAKGIIVDVITSLPHSDRPIYLEFHHKSDKETINNKVSIYILEKLKEYAINFGISKP